MAEASTAMSAADIARAAMELLQAAGYAPQDGDDSLMGIAAMHTWREILNFCSIAEIPQELAPCAASLAAAEFITVKKAFGKMEGFAGLNLDPAIKQLQEGDTSISFDTANTASPEKRLDIYVAHLNGCRSQLISFRKLRW
ncbi:MAG: hypothetical protein J6M10_05695 [Clostridia bacterium]|nr:hypothetical protein [Clostridia bacterium]